MIWLLTLLFLIASPAWAGTSEEQPNGDQSIDTGFDTVNGVDACGTGSTCWDEIDENFTGTCSTDADANEVIYDACDVATDRRDRFNMTNPPDSTLTASATQTIKVCAQACDSGQTGDPTITIEVYCSGDADGSPQTSSGACTLLNDGGSTECTHTFTDADVTCSGASQDIEIGLLCTAAGGSPGARNGCWIDLIEWQADTSAASTRRMWVVD